MKQKQNIKKYFVTIFGIFLAVSFVFSVSPKQSHAAANGQDCFGNNDACDSGYCDLALGTSGQCADLTTTTNTNSSQQNSTNPSQPAQADFNTSATANCPGGLTKDKGSGLCLLGNTQTGLAGSSSLSDLITQIIDFLLFVSGLIAVIFIIIGGFWYVTSAGNAEQAEKGQKALVNAVIGLIIIVMAYAIVTIINNALSKDITASTAKSTITTNGSTPTN